MWGSVKLCVCLCVCVFSILIAATRSYSRSTGALHTPDTFGAAGEGWVHVFLCTSPTHSASIFVDSSSLLSSHASPRWLIVFFFFCSSMSRLFIFPSFLTFSAPGCQIFQWNRMFPPFQLPVDNHSVSFTDASFFLWAPSRLCRDIGSLSYFLLIILSPPVAPAMSPNESSHRLTCFFHVNCSVNLLVLSMWQRMMNWINSGGKKKN